jgi:hypothetical protein
MTDAELEERLAQKIATAADAHRNLAYLQENADVEVPSGIVNLSSLDIEQAESMRRLSEPPG